MGERPTVRPPGRPPRGGTPRRFRVVMTDEEHAALKDRAAREGVKVADLIRQIAPVSSDGPRTTAGPRPDHGRTTTNKPPT